MYIHKTRAYFGTKEYAVSVSTVLSSVLSPVCPRQCVISVWSVCQQCCHQCVIRVKYAVSEVCSYEVSSEFVALFRACIFSKYIFHQLVKYEVMKYVVCSCKYQFCSA